MAKLTKLWTAEAESDTDAITRFLATEGIDFDRWEVPASVRVLAAKGSPDEADKSAMLAEFRAHLDELADKKGYVDADVVCVRDVPGVDDALAKFDKVHYHDDDEVRAIVGGSGVFGFVGGNGRQFLVEVEAGDYLSVPAGMWHWFYCGPDKNITALRLFKDMSGWTPHYRSTERGGESSLGA